MRELEFRAWHKKYKFMFRVTGIEMICSDAISIQYRTVNIRTRSGQIWTALENVELMQYTGLKDKNGVKIFEGDIVNNGESENLIVLWSDYYQSFIIDEKIGVYGEQSDDRLYDCDDIEEYEPFKYKCVSYEVIGNIHENPELLEEK